MYFFHNWCMQCFVLYHQSWFKGSKFKQIFNYKIWKFFGGLCNILMLAVIDKTTVDFIEAHMRNINP